MGGRRGKIGNPNGILWALGDERQILYTASKISFVRFIAVLATAS